jgi:hypothetical protein
MLTMYVPTGPGCAAHVSFGIRASDVVRQTVVCIKAISFFLLYSVSIGPCTICGSLYTCNCTNKMDGYIPTLAILTESLSIYIQPTNLSPLSLSPTTQGPANPIFSR